MVHFWLMHFIQEGILVSCHQNMTNPNSFDRLFQRLTTITHKHVCYISYWICLASDFFCWFFLVFWKEITGSWFCWTKMRKKTSLLHKLLVYATACVQCIYSTATSPSRYKVIKSLSPYHLVNKVNKPGPLNFLWLISFSNP